MNTKPMSLSIFMHCTASAPGAIARRVRRSRRVVVVGEAAFRLFPDAIAYARTMPGARVRPLGPGWAVSVPLQPCAVDILAGRNTDRLAWSRP